MITLNFSVVSCEMKQNKKSNVMSHRVPILSVSQNRVLYGQNLERNVVLLFYNSVNPIPFTCHRLKNGAERDADDALLLSIGPIADSDLAELRLLRRPL